MKSKNQKIFLIALGIMIGIAGTVVAIEIGQSLSGAEFLAINVATENWCRQTDVERTTENIVYWYSCKDIEKITPSNYTVVERIITAGYPSEDYTNCIGRGGDFTTCLALFYDEKALSDIRGYVEQLREDLFRKQREARQIREFPRNTQRFTEQQING